MEAANRKLEELFKLALILLGRRQNKKAAKLLREVITRSEQINDQVHLIRAMTALGDFLHQQERDEEARVYLKRVVETKVNEELDDLLDPEQKLAGEILTEIYSEISIRVGNYKVAKEWIKKSMLSQVTKNSLINFVDKFKDYQFFKEPPEVLEKTEFEEKVSIPKWYKDLKQVFDFIYSDALRDQQVLMELDLPANLKAPHDWRYFANITGYLAEDDKKLWQSNDLVLLPIAYEEALESVLAINLRDEKDLSIYSINPHFIKNKVPFEKAVTKVFDTYPDMLMHVKGIELHQQKNLMEYLKKFR